MFVTVNGVAPLLSIIVVWVFTCIEHTTKSPATVPVGAVTLIAVPVVALLELDARIEVDIYAYPRLTTRAFAAGAPLSLSATPVVPAIVIAVLNAIPFGIGKTKPAPSESPFAGTGNVRLGAVVPTVTFAAVAL